MMDHHKNDVHMEHLFIDFDDTGWLSNTDDSTNEQLLVQG